MHLAVALCACAHGQLIAFHKRRQALAAAAARVDRILAADVLPDDEWKQTQANVRDSRTALALLEAETGEL